MARKRKRRHARENPLSDTTTLFLYGLGAVAVVGVGYLAYKKYGGSSNTMSNAQLPPPSPGQGGVQSTPPVTSPQGSSTPNSGPPIMAQAVMATRAIAPAPALSIHAPKTARTSTSGLIDPNTLQYSP